MQIYKLSVGFAKFLIHTVKILSKRGSIIIFVPNICTDNFNMIGLTDCNNFFVSCERTLNRELEGRAVVVLSNNDGCVVARSNEAKQLGIRMGQPAFQIKDLMKSGQVTALSGNHILYREISLRIHAILRRFAPATLDYSVDESFLIMDGIPAGELGKIGEAIWQTCWAEEHIPVTVGFAPSKTLAKIATEVGKKRGERVIVLEHESDWQPICDSLAINEMWGIGRRLAKRLYGCGVYSIGDFARKPLEWVRGTMGVVGERSWRELHGEDCIQLDFKQRKLQDSISESRTFPTDVDDFDYLRARIAIYCAHVSNTLRKQEGQCGTLSVFLQTNRFHRERGYLSPSVSYKFEPPTSDTVVITNAGVLLLERIFTPGVAYKRAGVVLSELSPAREIAPSLFDEDNAQLDATLRSRRLMHILDEINSGPGPHTVKLASQLTKGHPGHNDGYSSSFGAPTI